MLTYVDETVKVCFSSLLFSEPEVYRARERSFIPLHDSNTRGGGYRMALYFNRKRNPTQSPGKRRYRRSAESWPVQHVIESSSGKAGRAAYAAILLWYNRRHAQGLRKMSSLHGS
jgi:hypothetical protein